MNDLVPWLKMRIQRTDNLNNIAYMDVAGPGNGRHVYEIFRADNDDRLAVIRFQEGPRFDKDAVSGVLDEDLLEIVRHRLQCFQKGEFATRENACALTHVEEALMWLNKRKEDRKERNVLGTYNQ